MVKQNKTGFEKCVCAGKCAQDIVKWKSKIAMPDPRSIYADPALMRIEIKEKNTQIRIKMVMYLRLGNYLWFEGTNFKMHYVAILPLLYFSHSRNYISYLLPYSHWYFIFVTVPPEIQKDMLFLKFL